MKLRLMARPTIKRTGSKFESIKKVGEKEIGKEPDERQKSAILKIKNPPPEGVVLSLPLEGDKPAFAP